VDCRKDHDDGEGPVQEERPERCFLRVLFGIHPCLLQQPVKFPVDECMLVVSDPCQQTSEREILGLCEEFCKGKDSLFGNFLLH